MTPQNPPSDSIEAIAKLAAHDLRGCLTGLKVIQNAIKGRDTDLEDLLKATIERIGQISDRLNQSSR